MGKQNPQKRPGAASLPPLRTLPGPFLGTESGPWHGGRSLPGAVGPPWPRGCRPALLRTPGLAAPTLVL